MKKFPTVVPVGLFTLLLGVAAVTYAAEQPVLQEGERWIFKASTKDAISSGGSLLDGTYEVVYRKGEIEVTQDGALIIGNAAEELKRMILPDERGYLKFPITVGNQWTGRHFHDRRSGWRSMNYAVSGIEDLAVGGSTLRAFKIEGRGSVSVPSGTYEQKRAFSYSPDAKSVVKFFYDSAVGSVGAKVDIELVKFSASGK